MFYSNEYNNITTLTRNKLKIIIFRERFTLQPRVTQYSEFNSTDLDFFIMSAAVIVV